MSIQRISAQNQQGDS